MIKGKINVNWSEKDYKNLSWSHLTVKQDVNVNIVDGTTPTDRNGVSACNENLPDALTETAKSFGLAKTVCAVSRMDPGQTLPYHKDKYQEYIKRNDIQDTTNITRIIVFLHDQKPGHQLWIENEICMGPAGSYFGWTSGTEHMAANLGYESRYVLQITGVSQDE